MPTPPTHIEQLIDRYAAGATLPAKCLQGLSKEDLNAFPIPGTWSIQQVIIHLMDSDLIGSDRMKRVIAENVPLLVGYNETAFTNNLFYDRLDPTIACDIFEKNRTLTAVILRNLPPATFNRTGVHTERGLESLEHLVKGYTDHLDHHLRFINDKRRALGK